MNNLAFEIECYLLTAQRWVPADELCAQFHVRERALRDDRARIAGRNGANPAARAGLCSAFAISSDQGYRHVRCATDEELDRFIQRLRSHARGELRRVALLRRARHTARTGQPAFEKFTGQRVLL
jgi:hypothetical protein